MGTRSDWLAARSELDRELDNLFASCCNASTSIGYVMHDHGGWPNPEMEKVALAVREAGIKFAEVYDMDLHVRRRLPE
jgi:hypothetical protein